jgi:SH3-like domain-containing protein
MLFMKIWKKKPIWLSLPGLALTLMLLCQPAEGLATMLAVRGEKVNLRSGPGTAYSVKWIYGAGFPVKVLKEKGEWLQVIDFEQDTGWIHRSLLAEVSHVIVTAHRSSDSKINIRSGPGSGFDVVAKAYYGVVFESLGKSAKWVSIRHESGIDGWVQEDLVWGD